MIAAIYARKSTEQTGVADARADATLVTRARYRHGPVDILHVSQHLRDSRSRTWNQCGAEPSR